MRRSDAKHGEDATIAATAPVSAVHKHPTHSHSSGQQLFLWMLLDGIGLAIIAGCTILEGGSLWKDYFSEHVHQNTGSICFWVSGRSCQVLGLILLILHAATMQVQPQVERSGMILLTVGPLLNICGCSLFSDPADPYFLYNRQWMATELIELVGISVLDLSLLDAEHLVILSAEVAGFSILACAAVLDFDFSNGSPPEVGLKMDMIHLSDCFGLFLLTLVAVAQYAIKEQKHHQPTTHSRFK